MPIIFLPPELVRLIAECLRDDTHTLATLCLLDKETLGLVTPLLYKTVHLSLPQSMARFCETILQSKRNLGIHPTSIRFNPAYADEQPTYLIKAIQDTLYQTPNLINLALDIGPSRLTDLHRHLGSHPPPFSLHRLACYIFPSLMPFLSAQSSIHSLTTYPTNRISTKNPAIIRAPLSPSFLPNLKSITTDIFTAISLIPSRPISHVDLSCLLDYKAHRFYECLRKSSAPEGVDSLFVRVPQTRFQDGLLGFITPLREACGANLKELQVKVSIPRHINTREVNRSRVMRARLLTLAN